MFKKIINIIVDIREHLRDRPVIPSSAPWWFRYNLQGFFALKNFLELYFLQRSSTNLENPSVTIECAKEAYLASEFACIYGKGGNGCMRKLSNELEVRGLVTRYELRQLIHNYVLQPCQGGGIRLKASLFWAVYMAIFLVFLAAYTVILSTAVLFTSLNFFETTGAILAILLVSGAGGYCFYYCSIKSYLLSRKAGNTICEWADMICIKANISPYPHLVYKK